MTGTQGVSAGSILVMVVVSLLGQRAESQRTHYIDLNGAWLVILKDKAW